MGYLSMVNHGQLSRRSALRIATATGIATFAGCSDGGGGNGNDGNGGGDGEGVDIEQWAEVDEFVLEGQIQHWTVVEPESIESEENPPITLIEGQEYDFTWENVDGVTHNLEIRDETDEVIDDYQSDDVGEEGERTTLEGVVASEEMVTYICQFHPSTQVGDITVESE